MICEHGGHLRRLASLAGCQVEDILDFSASINPLGPPDCLRRVIARNLGAVVHYPDPQCQELTEAIARRFAISPEQVVVGNGSTEILYALPRALDVARAVIPVPGYVDYAAAAARGGLETECVVLEAAREFALDWPSLESRLRGGEMVVVGQPSNPAGAMFDSAALLDAATRHSSTVFVVDEAFADFVEGYQSLIHHERPNILVLRSMTKFYAIPGLRLGYALAPEPLAARIRDCLPPWSVGVLAQAVGQAVLEDETYVQKTREEVRRLRGHLERGLAALPGIRVFTSAANYLLARLDRTGLEAPELARRLLAHRIAIRVCDNYAGLDRRYFRVAVRTQEENERLLDALAAVLKPAAHRLAGRLQRRRTPAVMFQGTSSNAGKSVLAAAFCRILLQDGYRVAPFKAQNMSLNSHVTLGGGEMGRAQVVQAQACRLNPDVRMNPVLLKPNSDTGAQVIVLGKPVGNMDVGAYIRYKPQAFETVKQTYDSLASEVDVVVLEGAGSPAEVNLKHHDIVNMAMAEHAKAPVLLVGDIDRGGVFASFVGTLEVLSERERAMVAGFVVNRFRGQKDLLEGALAYTERHTGLPTYGVIPYLRDLGLPEEDSVSFKAWEGHGQPPKGADQVEVAVIDLPHISNFTDFDPLKLESDVCLRIVRTPEELGSPDAVILPGSKNVPGDLKYLQGSGLAGRILELAQAGRTELVGVCGGLQMLGSEIADPHGIESGGEALRGLSLLPVKTILRPEKTLKAATARHVESGLVLKGYEIHHGSTSGGGLPPAVVRDDGEDIGFRSEDGRIWGTYLHGLFDNDEFRRWFIDRLRVRRGLAPVGKILATYDLEPALERLADRVRVNLQVEEIYRRMGLK
jgi:cobyric acid synthase CobQ/L-threonine-O-3-phosphate decarboxylase